MNKLIKILFYIMIISFFLSCGRKRQTLLDEVNALPSQIGFSFEKISQPMAGAVFKRDLVAPPRAWAEKIYNIVQWNMHDGGHFAALEKPETLSSDIINFIQKLDIV